MPSVRYLIVGGGLTADGACKGIREIDGDGSIAVVGAEPHPPYLRPPLSKGLWKGDGEETIWRGTGDLDVDLLLSRRIVSLDLAARSATDDRGEAYAYERVLFATGGQPRRLAVGGDDVIYYRTLDDYRHLRSLAEGSGRFVVIGGGFIGSEIAAALAMNDCSATIVFPDDGVCSRIFPADLSAFVTDYYKDRGVEVLAGDSVSAIERADGGLRVTTEAGRTLEADGVVAGIGIEPNTDLAASAGMEISAGIAVDPFGRVIGYDDVFAAGDVARFPAKALGTSMRVEHEDHAKNHGKQVGRNMAGADEPYDYLPFFYSDLFDLGYEAVGELDSRQDSVAEWKTPNREGLVYYVDEHRRPRGVLLWNVFDHVDDARALIEAGEPIDRRSLRDLLA